MKHTSSIIAMALLLLCSCNDNKGQQKTDSKLDSALTKIDSQVGKFNPAYINDAANSHVAYSVSFANNQFTLVPGKTSVRPGRAPYLLNDTSKTFVVRFRDANNRLISSYSFLHPGLLRACDGKRPGISIRDSVTFEILMPANRQIHSFDISTNGKQLTQFVVPTQDNTDTTGVKVQ